MDLELEIVKDSNSSLTPSPSPKVGEGSKTPAPLLPPWEKGLGDEGDTKGDAG
jgi:hypothetical protein